MNIALLNTKITLQKNTVEVDEYGNHKAAWQDYYTCHATVSNEHRTGTEQQAAGETVNHEMMNFTIRWCKAVDRIDTKNFRILYNENIYNIDEIDRSNNRRRNIKLYAKKVDRE